MSHVNDLILLRSRWLKEIRTLLEKTANPEASIQDMSKSVERGITLMECVEAVTPIIHDMIRGE